MKGHPKYKEALLSLEKASNFYSAGGYEEAYREYKVAFMLLHWLCKRFLDDNLKEALYPTLNAHVTRAEEIKKILEKGKVDSLAQAASAGSAESSKDKKESEEGKLKAKLEAAIITEKPSVKWSDISGLESAKASLQEAVILPARFPELFIGNRKPWKGILLYGPPGTGKTYLAKACASEADATFLSVSSADLMSKWQGESEKLVRELFHLAKEKKPSIVFIDEVDSLCGARSDNESESSRRVKTEFLVQMQGVGSDSGGILVLGATNLPWSLDSAIRRRFEKRIYIPLPDEKARKSLLIHSLSKNSCTLDDDDLSLLAEKTEGYSGADLAILVRDAFLQPVRNCQNATHFKKIFKDNSVYYTPCSKDDPDQTVQESTLMSIPSQKLLPPDVSMDDFLKVLVSSRTSVGAKDIEKHVEWTKLYGQEGN